jgi:hypothetical protein
MDIAVGRAGSITVLLLYRSAALLLCRSAALLLYFVGLGSAALRRGGSRWLNYWSSLP